MYRAFFVSFYFIACLLLQLSCQANDNESSRVSLDRISSLSGEKEQKLSRVDLINASNRQALEAIKIGNASTSESYYGAAELRQYAYWLFGNGADADEAVELFFKATEQQDSADSANSACKSGLKLVQLRGIRGGDLHEFYRMLFVLHERWINQSCRKEVQVALQLLKDYAPSDEQLQALRRKIKTVSGLNKNADEPVVGLDETKDNDDFSAHQAVVSPELLEANLRESTTISRIEHYAAERSARIVVHVAHPTQFKVGELKAASTDAGRLFVDIERASYIGQTEFALGGLVEAVRVGQHASHTRIVVDLNRAASHRVFYLPEPFRLVVDLSTQTQATQVESRVLSRVVLDPGHGGSDPGALSKNGLKEKDITLDIAHRAAPLLAREVGVSTLLTRDIDVYVPLDERAAKANAFHADLFISIHVNSSPNPASRGIMTFVLDASRDRSAAQVAARENHSSEAAAADLANSLSRIESRRRREASELFARLLQRSSGASLRANYDGVEDHGVKRAGFYVLAGAAMPAVLYEGSFLSNPTESRRLKSGDYRQRLADSIVNAVRAYKLGL